MRGMSRGTDGCYTICISGYSSCTMDEFDKTALSTAKDGKSMALWKEKMVCSL